MAKPKSHAVSFQRDELSLLPSEKSLLFEFGADDCLYRDHLGHRVLADVESRGFFRVLRAASQLNILADDVPQMGTQGTYEQNLLISTPNPGPFVAAVYIGRSESIQGPVVQGDRFEGCGWIVSTDLAVCVDNDHQRHGDFDGRFPIPFFLEASGKGLGAILSSTNCEVLDRFSVADVGALSTRNWTVQNVSSVAELRSEFEDGVPYQGQVLSHLNAAHWKMSLPKGTRGLVLRKLYDAFHGRQRARVLVDEHFAGWWYEPVQDRVHRWRWASFGIEERFLTDKDSIEITIDPPAGAPLWSLASIEILRLWD